MSKDEQLKIKISIADRVYPLTVSYAQEEALRTASKKIESMIHQFEKNYAVRDKQDVLAMCALQLASQSEQKTIDTTEGYNKSVDRLIKLDQVLESILSKK